MMDSLIPYLPGNLAGKKVLLAGGTKGLGRNTALELAALGAKVMILGLNQSELDETMAQIRSMGKEGDCYGMVADTANPEDLKIIFTVIDRHFRGLDIFINNELREHQRIVTEGYQNWKEMLELNLMGHIRCTNEAVNRMQQKGAGYIIDVNNRNVEVSKINGSMYEAIKAGIRNFNERLQNEVNKMGITVALIQSES